MENILVKNNTSYSWLMNKQFKQLNTERATHTITPMMLTYGQL